MTHEDNESAPLPEAGERASSPPYKRRRWQVWVGVAAMGLVALGAIVLALTAGSRAPASARGATPAPAQSAAMAPTSSVQAPISPTITPAHGMPAAMGSQKSWILLPPLPADATQADTGAQIYRLVCSTCHGSAGEGLSYGPWVKTSAENCWQANCHGKGHPRDGFELPRYIPPVVGPNTIQKFQNALALYQFVRATMPMQARGTMLDEEYWEVTAFLVRENGFDPMLKPLDAERAAEVPLR
ncbi:MAG: hypothetical protein ACM30E_08165 [Nitrososphaerales archaeon]